VARLRPGRREQARRFGWRRGVFSAAMTLELTIRAEGGLAGIPRETLNPVVLEGLRQLGLTDVNVEEG
jgi:hypothetical protein